MSTLFDSPMDSPASKPVALFRKLTKSFRSTRRRRQSVLIADSCQFEPSPSKKSKTLNFDSDFSLNNFLKNLKTQLGSSKNAVNEEPALISCKKFTTSRKVDFTDLVSTKCFIDILKFLPPDDLRNVRLVCQSFNKIVQDHALDLQRKKFFKMEIVENELGELGLRRFGTSSANSPLKLDLIDRPLRHIEALNISLRRLTVTGKTVRYLHRAIKYPVNEMKFFDCIFQIRSRELATMIRRWNVDSLEFHQCQWNLSEDLINDCQFFVDDQFFSVNPDIRFICFDFSFQDEQKLGFTDKLVRYFKKTQFFPETFVLNNCSSLITSKTLFAAISVFIDSADDVRSNENLPNFYSWTFGRLLETKDEILSHLSPFFNYAIVKDVDDDRIHLVFKVRDDYPILYFVVHLHPFLPVETSEDEFSFTKNEPSGITPESDGDNEIDWDDSFSEED